MSTSPTLRVRSLVLDDPVLRDAPLTSMLPADGGCTWVRRGDGLVGYGEAHVISAEGDARFAHAQSEWQQLVNAASVNDTVQQPGSGLVAFGSFAFSGTSTDTSVLVVPRVVIGRREETTWLTIIDRADESVTAPDSVVAQLRTQALAEVAGPGEVTSHRGTLGRGEWSDVVARAVSAINDEQLDKVVLARDLNVTAQARISPRWVTSRLADTYEACWTFHVAGLFGATPELLIRRERGLVTSRVLAGTIPRTGDDQADLTHAATLAHSSKDLEEHEYAVASVATRLRPYCASLNVPETPFVLHLPNVMHLATDVTGVLDADGAAASSLELAAALHPTAAVCGTPTSAAAALIEDIEGMDRGRYAAPVGWIGASGDGEWGLALRSAHIDSDDGLRARLFAGCGIVGSSDPATELAESEAKMTPVLDALGVVGEDSV